MGFNSGFKGLNRQTYLQHSVRFNPRLAIYIDTLHSDVYNAPLTVACSDVFSSPVNSGRRKSPLSNVLPNHDSWISRQSTQHYQYNIYIFVTNWRDVICTARVPSPHWCGLCRRAASDWTSTGTEWRWLSQIMSHFNTDTHTAINYFCPQIRYRFGWRKKRCIVTNVRPIMLKQRSFICLQMTVC